MKVQVVAAAKKKGQPHNPTQKRHELEQVSPTLGSISATKNQAKGKEEPFEENIPEEENENEKSGL